VKATLPFCIACAVLAVWSATAAATEQEAGEGGQRHERTYTLVGPGMPDEERAVLRALHWFKEHQNEDGSWGEEPHQAAMTGLALLAFLGHGEDHLSAEYGATVAKAIQWLVKHQDDDGFFAKRDRQATEHAMATYAIAEAYAMTGLEGLKPVVVKALGRILDGLTSDGGWYENYAKARDDGSPLPGGDTLVSAWQVQALTAAWYAGVRLPDDALRDARRAARRDMQSRFSFETGFGPTGNEPGGSLADNYTTTAAGASSLALLGERDSKEAQAAFEMLGARECDWDKTETPTPGPLYTWYYVTWALLRAHPSPRENVPFRRWLPLTNKTLVAHQDDGGTWGYPPSESGRRERALYTGKNRAVYSTALACLTIEAYYRYLPTATAR
jgi:hypothetical protein